MTFIGELAGQNVAQMTAAWSLTMAPLVGDATGDGVVDQLDGDLVLANLGMTGSPGITGDVSGPTYGVPDGVVDLTDHNAVQNNLGRTDDPPSPHPTPRRSGSSWPSTAPSTSPTSSASTS